MTFAEFMAGYGRFYQDDAWLSEYIESLIQKGIATVELVSNEIQERHRDLMLADRNDIAAIGLYWTQRDRLIYMMSDWQMFLDTGKKYF